MVASLTYLFALYVVPAFLVPALFLIGRHESMVVYSLLLACFTFVALCLFHGFRWEILGIKYRAAAYALFLVFVGVSIFRNHALLASQIVASLVCLGCMISTFLFVNVYTARISGERLSISSPFGAAKWIVAQGGNNAVQNAHRGVEAQRHALDLVLIDDGGARATGLQPRNLSDYHSFGSEVVAPVDGTIARIRNSEDDQAIGAVDTEKPLGNFVLIHSEGKTLVLAHLMKGSISVQEGDRVCVGDFVARVGNSGRTSEPHLHIHAIGGYEVEEAEVIWGGKPIALLFDSRYLRKGDVFAED